MYYRRKILLNFISAFGEQGIEKLKLQKLLFLLCQAQDKPAFDFVPYKYGCFSFQAAKDLHVLKSHYQLLKQDGAKWLIHQPFNDELQPKEQSILSQLLNDFKHQNTTQTVSYVYDRYPYYSIKSQREMTVQQKKAAQKEIDTINTQEQKSLFTIGYEGKSIDAYLSTLVQNNIKLLCDVRKNPISMKYGFSKNQLKQYCAKLNIVYEHIPELGITSQNRQNLKEKQDYQNLFKVYQVELPTNQTGIEKVLYLLDRHKRIALTCFEKAHQDCHRHCVSNYLQEKNQLDCQHL